MLEDFFFLLWKFEKFKKGRKTHQAVIVTDLNVILLHNIHTHLALVSFLQHAEKAKEILQKPRTAGKISEEEGL